MKLLRVNFLKLFADQRGVIFRNRKKGIYSCGKKTSLRLKQMDDWAVIKNSEFEFNNVIFFFLFIGKKFFTLCITKNIFVLRWVKAKIKT